MRPARPPLRQREWILGRRETGARSIPEAEVVEVLELLAKVAVLLCRRPLRHLRFPIEVVVAVLVALVVRIARVAAAAEHMLEVAKPGNGAEGTLCLRLGVAWVVVVKLAVVAVARAPG